MGAPTVGLEKLDAYETEPALLAHAAAGTCCPTSKCWSSAVRSRITSLQLPRPCIRPGFWGDMELGFSKHACHHLQLGCSAQPPAGRCLAC